MAVDPKAREFALTYDGGYFRATVGLLEYLYGPNFGDNVGAGQSKSVSVKGHTRQRVIGGPSTSVAGYSYNYIDYPHRNKGTAATGQQIAIQTDDGVFSARVGGSIQDFKAFLAGTGKPLKAFMFSTERGTEYSSAS